MLNINLKDANYKLKIQNRNYVTKRFELQVPDSNPKGIYTCNKYLQAINVKECNKYTIYTINKYFRQSIDETQVDKPCS